MNETVQQPQVCNPSPAGPDMVSFSQVINKTFHFWTVKKIQ